ncbi:MAG TPA: hypothetical protein VN914_02395 [Polyangia bacterium]|nr:hypothetical protein [Polyangia bacterium]
MSDRELLLSIGGVVGRFALGAAPRPFLAQLRERYDAFTLPRSPAVDHIFTVDLRFRSARPAPDRWRKASSHPLVVKSDDRTVEIDRWDFTATLERRGPLGGGFAGQATCELNPFALDSFLRILWSIFLPRAGGALFHACGLRHGHVGVLAPGPSGAGKTTLARKMPDPDDVLSDEVVAVHPDGEGGWLVSGSPFWGEFARGGVSLRSFPLAAMAFLEQTPAAQAAPVSAADALMRALGCMICFERSDEAVARNLAVVSTLIADVPTVACGTRAETTAAQVFELLRPHLARDPAAPRPPRSPREMISELRAHLRRHEGYAFRPRGGSMRPWMRTGDSLFVTRVKEEEIHAGDVLLYWRPGATPDDDALTCHRMVARVSSGKGGSRIYTKGDALPSIEAFENGRQAEILGKVQAISRDGRISPVAGRSRNLAMLFGSLVSIPLLKMLRRHERHND